MMDEVHERIPGAARAGGTCRGIAAELGASFSGIDRLPG
jgi:hypothetical protein